MDDVKVSVIIPVYNTQERYILDCVDSIVNQTYHNLEIILVDDGSDEQTAECLDRIEKADKRIQVIHKKHEGVSMARNVGVENALGDYVMFVDSDDYLYSKGVITEAVSLQVGNDNAADLIIGMVERTDRRYKKEEWIRSSVVGMGGY